MLLELHIKNYALIDCANLSFSPGFTVLTGETGAGKSILIDAVSTVLGSRVQVADIMGSADTFALVEAAFAMTPTVRSMLEEMGITAEDEAVILSRHISDNGRSRCRINGQLVNVSALQKLGKALVDIHGQHEHQSLFSVHHHLNVLDAFAGPTALSLREEVAFLVRRRTDLRRQLAEITANERERIRQMDILQFQVEEIAAASLDEGEDKALLAERSVLANAEKLHNELTMAYAVLCESEDAFAAVDTVGQATDNLAEAARFDAQCKAMLATLRDIQAQLAETGREIRWRRDQVKADPERLNQIESRLDVIENLKRKYGGTIAEVLQFACQANSELENLGKTNQMSADIEDELKQIEVKLVDTGLRLHGIREKAASELDKQVVEHLQQLAMTAAVFRTHLTQPVADNGIALADGKIVGLNERGLDACEFLFSANPDEEAKPLSRIASGGEISRVMLAIKAALAKADPIPTLIFDEIDAGIGGRAATAVAHKLAKLSQNHQVLCVTHLAQVASAGESHIQIEKTVTAGQTQVSLRSLSGQERVNELARMLDGTNSPTTLIHARELLAWAQKGAN